MQPDPKVQKDNGPAKTGINKDDNAINKEGSTNQTGESSKSEGLSDISSPSVLGGDEGGHTFGNETDPASEVL